MRKATIESTFLLFDPCPFPLIFLRIEILLILLFDSLAGVLILGIEGAQFFDGGVDVLDEFHLHVEEACLFDLLVDEVYLLVEELYFLGELDWTVGVHLGMLGINKIGNER